MAIDELRAKDLAAIEPPGSISKIVEFARQLSFGQEGLFAGVDLPTPPITQQAFASQEVARQIASKPYAMFPGANGEGLDSLMSHYAVRSRDIQDFTRWLMRWDEVRTQLTVVESPEQYFLRRATPQMIESFQAHPEVQKVILEGRRRSRVVQGETHVAETEDRRVLARRAGRSQAAEEETEAQGPRETRRAVRRHPEPKPEEPDYREYWREQPAEAVKAPIQSKAIAPVEPPPITTQSFMAGLSRGVVMSNVGLGSTTFGLIRGREDATQAYRALLPDAPASESPTASVVQGTPALGMPVLQSHVAASRAEQGSPVAPYMAQQAPAVVHHYPPPEVYVREVQIAPGSRGFPAEAGPPDIVVVTRKEAVSSGLKPVEGVQPSPGLSRAAAAAIAATLVVPAFAGAPGAYSALPGFNGIAANAFAGQIAGRPNAVVPGQDFLAAGIPGFQGSVMPAGTLPRKDVFASGIVEGAPDQALFRGGLGAEPAVRTPIPGNPLLGQITLISPPLQVASQESERSGTAVAFGIQDIAKGAGALDAGGLAMLQKSLPPGAQAIYPALPLGSLGPQAVNMSLAPSLLGQILTQGYGPQAGPMAGLLASSAAAALPAGGGMGPVQASIIPTSQRPTDASAGLFGGRAKSTTGGLEEAGAGTAGRHGALDFLGMPVRLAPSLSGSTDVKHAAEARKVLPAGSAAMVRPNDFGPLKTKVFPSLNTVHAEPDKTAWRKAAPSFGLRDAEPHTLLSPDARIKPPHAGAPLPQMVGGGHTPAAQALSAAASIAPAAAAAGVGSAASGLGRMFGSSAKMAAPGTHTPDLGISAAHFGGTPAMADRHHFHAPSPSPAPSSINFLPSFMSAAPSVAPRFMPRSGGIPSSMPSFSSGRSTALPSAAASASSGSSRVASRFSAYHPSSGAGPTGTVHDGSTSHGMHGSTVPEEHHSYAPEGSGFIPMSKPGGAASPAMPAVRSMSTGARPSSAGGGFAMPSMARPSMPTTSRGGFSAPSFSTSGSASASSGSSGSRGSVSTTSSTSLFSRAPDMPIATSVPARGAQAQSSTIIQKALHGGAVHANRTEHEPQTEEHSTNPQAQDPGAAAHEINLLANEVWSLLKRKLLFESERLGRRY